MECSTLVVFTLIPFRLSPWGFSGSSLVKNLPGNAGDTGLIPGLVRSPEKEMVNHSSILAWKNPRSKEPGGLPSMGSQKNRIHLSD